MNLEQPENEDTVLDEMRKLTEEARGINLSLRRLVELLKEDNG